MPLTQPQNIKNRQWGDQQGFTLVELLVALALTAILSVTIAYTFRVQAFTHKTQEEVAALQQNLRAAMFFIESDLRLAGSDPTDTATDTLGNKAGFLSSTTDPQNGTNSIYFSMNRSATPNGAVFDNVIGQGAGREIIKYRLGSDNELEAETITSTGTSNFQTVASAITGLAFTYFAKPNSDGTPNQIFPDGGGVIPPNRLNNICRVVVTMTGTTPNSGITKTLTSYVWLRSMSGC